MGSGIAQCLVESGRRVVLVDITEDHLSRARQAIRQGLRMRGLLGRRPAAGEGAHELLSRIAFTCDDGLLATVDLVIENVVEKWTVKEAVYRRLDRICPPECVFAANTSAISITRLAGVTRRPDRVVGMHFMNPAPLKPMVEVVRGHHTSAATLERAMALLVVMGKEGVVVEDMPGFVTNRVLMLTLNEAIWVVQDRVAGPEDVDRLFVSCFGHAMGPLATADLIGLDTVLDSLEVLHQSYGDDKFRPCPLLRRMVDAGLHGRKSRRGFYDYGVEG
jgi:3-hydroxybutyryl-CoA dehydrogenase